MTIAKRFITAIAYESASASDLSDGTVVGANSALQKLAASLSVASPAYPVVAADQLPVGLPAAATATYVGNGQTWSCYIDYDVNEGVFRGVTARSA